ncbi:MAG: MFS transporter [Actinomycetota bacterium]|nr:MFS transporter [Actinomycetota bacterium]
MSSPPIGSPAPDPASLDEPPVLDAAQKRNILISMCLALMGVIASVSGLNVAQQDLAVDLDLSQGTILWVINAYTVALAALLMPIGAVGDRWGRKPVLMTGLGLFALASLAGAVATSGAMLIAARTVAGIGAAMIMPVTLSVITSTFPEEERGQAIGIWAGVAGSGGLIGLFASALAVDVLSWRWLFTMPVVLAAVAVAISLVSVPNSREHAEHPFDTIGSITSFLAIGGLVLGIHEGPEQGWGAAITVAGLGIGVVSLAAFVWWELRHPDPLLDIRVFRDRALSSGSLALMVLFATMFGIFLVLFPYFQAVVGWSALRSAVGLLPMALVMMPTSALAPQVVKRIGTRATMLVGISLGVVGVCTLALRASVAGGYFSVLPGLLIVGLGFGLSMTPSTEAITAGLPAAKQGVASALNDTSREVGGALGIALLGSILSSGYESAIEPSLGDLPPELAEPAREGIGGALGAAPSAGERAPELINAAQHAFVDGWVQSMWVGAVLLAVPLLYLVVRGPRRSEATADLPGTGDFAIAD